MIASCVGMRFQSDSKQKRPSKRLFGRATVRNWVHKAEQQPKSGRNTDHVAVDETVIRFNNEVRSCVAHC